MLKVAFACFLVIALIGFAIGSANDSGEEIEKGIAEARQEAFQKVSQNAQGFEDEELGELYEVGVTSLVEVGFVFFWLGVWTANTFPFLKPFYELIVLLVVLWMIPGTKYPIFGALIWVWEKFPSKKEMDSTYAGMYAFFGSIFFILTLIGFVSSPVGLLWGVPCLIIGLLLMKFVFGAKINN